MTRAARIIIFYTFLILFLITAPAILFYTAGYRLDISHGRLSLVGALLIKSTPRGADVKLNGQLARESTPALIELAPNDYNIEVTKDGYHGWSKELSVKSRETTFAEDIVLWKNAEPQTLLKKSLSNVIFSNDNRFAAFSEANDQNQIVKVFDLNAGTENALATIKANSSPILIFSPENNSLLVRVEDYQNFKLYVIRLDGITIDVGQKFPQFSLANSLIDWGETDGNLYALRNDSLYALNLFTGRADAIAKSGNKFMVSGTDVWSLTKDGRTLMRSRAGDAISQPEPIAELPNSINRFLKIDKPYLALLDDGGKILVIDSHNPTEIIATVTGDEMKTRKNRNGELEILTRNRFELWRANAQSGAVELLRRQSDPILDANWLTGGEYVIFTSAGRIEALELDNRDERNVTRLANFDGHEIPSMSIDSRGDRLYFSAIVGPESGLYSLELQ